MLKDIVYKLEYIVKNEEHCVFDLTGGEDLALVAMGMIYQKYKSKKNIQMHRFQISTAELIDCDNDGILPENACPQITVKDQIMLHGGRIIAGKECKLLNNPVQVKIINSLWELCKKDANGWNKKVSILAEFEKNKSNSSPLEVQVSLSPLNRSVKNFIEKKNIYLNFLRELHTKHLIEKLNVSDAMVLYRYSNTFIRSCLQKAGNILEYKTLLIAIEMGDGSNRYFNDALCGVEMDWDGQVINPDGTLDTRNEIDVFLMKNLTPVFISCKNGTVDEDELYKLHTVAHRFGSKYAKKILVATELPLQQTALRFFLQRATDMDIKVINNVKYMSDIQFAKKLKSAIE